MENLWNDAEAKSFREKYKAFGTDLADRIYTSRLIGRDTTLVLHGGGNTSVKSTYTDILGRTLEALFVKGSGWNLDTIEPKGFPGLHQKYLQTLRVLDAMTDEEMVNQLRTHMFDAGAPNPSVETLLHAFLPEKFIDHSHADAILALTNQPGGMEIVKEIFGSRLAIVPYIMPGFALSKLAADVYDTNPGCEGLLLYRHGLFTFGPDAKTSYDRHIHFVNLAESCCQERVKNTSICTPSYDSVNAPRENAATAAMLLRGLLAEEVKAQDDNAEYKRMILHTRCNHEILAFANSAEAESLCARGPLTPDHVIRTKEKALYVANPDYSNPENLKLALQEAVQTYRNSYHAYFEEQSRIKARDLKELDPFPRVIVMPGAGMFTAGRTRKDAMIAADIYEHTIYTKSRCHAMGGYESLTSSDLFDVEYWSLEQAKLGKAVPKALAGQVAVITGAGGAVGRGIAIQLAAAGAHLALLDIRQDSMETLVKDLSQKFGNVADAFVCDVTDREAVEACLDKVCLAFGGFDILVPNAGIACSAAIDEMDSKKLEEVMAVNFMGYFHLIQAGARRLKQQNTGGHIIINSSKNVFAPGKDFAAYSASKAAGHQLGKIAAMELAPHGIRVNMINADAIFSHDGIPSGLWEAVGPGRAQTRGLEVKDLYQYYRERNLLKASVSAEHVGNAVVFFATNQTPTTGATLPVDGGIPEAFPR